MEARMLKILAPAKVNWFLEIKGKRPDGFHEIETVMQAIDLFDEITVADRDDTEVTLTCDIDLGAVEDNLVYRAARLLQQRHAPGRGVDITLTKRIPHGAGLGGGSSDAANTLKALDKLWNLRIDNSILRNLAAELGSDCAFFIEGGTAICTGRGEVVTPIQDIAGLDLVILYPEEVVGTASVYQDLSRHLTYEPQNCYLFHDLPDDVDAVRMASLVANRLEESAIRVSKRLQQVWEQTAQEVGVLVRFVSGSGSSIVFLMPERSLAEQLVESLQDRKLGRAFATKTLPRGAVWG
jgi:4-diphosphocytidyl-2-C-methyl-D-erythritol kinase